jgi:F0F1-type ATP synthase membrane subunit c/vacuolar-type H+-ATPase subunit K
VSWKQKQQNTSALVSHASAWAAQDGLGTIFGNYLNGALRNPSAADGQFGRLIFGFAVTEALGIFSLLVALPPALRCLILFRFREYFDATPGAASAPPNRILEIGHGRQRRT